MLTASQFNELPLSASGSAAPGWSAMSTSPTSELGIGEGVTVALAGPLMGVGEALAVVFVAVGREELGSAVYVIDGFKTGVERGGEGV